LALGASNRALKKTKAFLQTRELTTLGAVVVS